jgi:endonuclease III
MMKAGEATQPSGLPGGETGSRFAGVAETRMATTKRTQLLTKLQKVLKQNYKTVLPDTGRPVLEQVLFACCLENAAYESAEKAFAQLGENYFDLNEVRVTTVAELAEALQQLPNPSRAALSLRRVLQSVFESTYSFSLEHARKGSIANGVKTLQGLQGVPSFVTAFVVSTGLGGHTIPLDDGALVVLWLTGLITQEEYDSRAVPWLERAIPKKAGKEFASLLHQFGADLLASIHSPALRKLVLSINPDAKDLFPKRGASLPSPQPANGTEGLEAGPSEDHRPAGPQAAARPVGKTPMPPPGSGPKRTADGKSGKSGPKPFVVKPNMARPLTIKPEAAEQPAAAESAAVEEKPSAKKKPAASAASAAKQKKAKKVAAPKKVSPKSAAKASTGKAAVKASSGKAKKSAAKGSAGKKVTAKTAAGKATGSGHARQLAKRKPR